MTAPYITIYNKKTGKPCRALLSQVSVMCAAGFSKVKPDVKAQREIIEEKKEEKPVEESIFKETKKPDIAKELFKIK